MSDDDILDGAFDAADRDTGMQSYAEVATRAAIPLARVGYIPADRLPEDVRERLTDAIDYYDDGTDDPLADRVKALADVVRALVYS